ncbi:MAG: type VII secretion target [Mycobacterium sp.]|nr:type VII secretion target [Mycobacterium sp.]
MGDPLYVNTEGVLGMARVHDAVTAGLGRLHGGAGPSVGPGPGTTHGLIAFGMNSALGGVMDRRGDILRSAGAAGQQMSEQLRRAAEAYRAGDEQGAQGLAGAAERIPGGGVTGGIGAAAPGGIGAAAPGGIGAAVPGSPAAGIGGGSGDVGQTLGQVGQQARQIAQSIAQPIQGVAQALGQLPQHVVQGLSGVLGGLAGGLGGGGLDGGGLGAGHAAASGSGGLSDPSGGGADSVGGQDNSDADGRDRDHDPRKDSDRRDPERHDKGRDEERILSVGEPGQTGSGAGAEPATGLADGTAPPPRRPAQTRPQDI